jgi:fatty-acyl-CoA synthase
MTFAAEEMPKGLAQVMNLGNLLTQTAQKFPLHMGFIHADNQHTWAELNKRVDALAHRLRAMGIRAGDRILVQLTNGLPLFESAFVAFKLGAVWVPVNFRLTPSEVGFIAESSGASLMITHSMFAEHASSVQAASPAVQILRVDGGLYEDVAACDHGEFAAVEVEYNHPLWFFFTSGTTGRPKAAVLTHGQMAFVVTNHLADLLPGLNEDDFSLVLAPLSHGAGIHALVNVARGAASVLLASDSLQCDAAYAAIERYRITNMFTVPTILKRIAEDPAAERYDHSSLKHVIYAGAPMYRADQERALAVLGPVLVQYFGLGEVTGNITVLRTDEHTEDSGALLGTCGSARVGMEVGILDENGCKVPVGEQGEICTRGPAVFAGYWNNPEANEKAFKYGWFHTGDLGRMDSRGFVTITGRQSDMFISGGSNVYPREIEEALLMHSQIQEAVVFGVPDESWGEAGVAILVLRPGASLDAESVLVHLKDRIAKYKWPRVIQFWPALPKSAYGKLVKKDIREEYFRRLHSLAEVAA